MKLAQKYQGKKDLEAMQVVAKALKERSLEQFEKNLKEYTNGELKSVLLGYPRWI
jgi:hypothetical protein